MVWEGKYYLYYQAFNTITGYGCDLSLDVDDPTFKQTELFEPPEEQYRQGLKPSSLKRIKVEYAIK